MFGIESQSKKWQAWVFFQSSHSISYRCMVAPCCTKWSTSVEFVLFFSFLSSNHFGFFLSKVDLSELLQQADSLNKLELDVDAEVDATPPQTFLSVFFCWLSASWLGKINMDLLCPERNHDITLDVPHTSSVSVVSFKLSHPQLPHPDWAVQPAAAPSRLSRPTRSCPIQTEPSNSVCPQPYSKCRWASGNTWRTDTRNIPRRNLCGQPVSFVSAGARCARRRRRTTRRRRGSWRRTTRPSCWPSWTGRSRGRRSSRSEAHPIRFVRVAGHRVWSVLQRIQGEGPEPPRTPLPETMTATDIFKTLLEFVTPPPRITIMVPWHQSWFRGWSCKHQHNQSSCIVLRFWPLLGRRPENLQNNKWTRQKSHKWHVQRRLLQICVSLQVWGEDVSDLQVVPAGHDVPVRERLRLRLLQLQGSVKLQRLVDVVSERKLTSGGGDTRVHTPSHTQRWSGYELGRWSFYWSQSQFTNASRDLNACVFCIYTPISVYICLLIMFTEAFNSVLCAVYLSFHLFFLSFGPHFHG